MQRARRCCRCGGFRSEGRERSDDVQNTASTWRRGPAVLGRVRGASTDEGRSLAGGEAEAERAATTEEGCCALRPFLGLKIQKANFGPLKYGVGKKANRRFRRHTHMDRHADTQRSWAIGNAPPLYAHMPLAPTRSSKPRPWAPPPNPRLKPGPVFVASGDLITLFVVMCWWQFHGVCEPMVSLG